MSRIPFALVLVAACSSTNSKGDDDSTPIDAPHTTTAVDAPVTPLPDAPVGGGDAVPSAGMWRYDMQMTTSNTCGPLAPPSGSTYTINSPSTAGFTVTTSSTSFPCTAATHGYACVETDTTQSEPGFSATFTTHITATAGFTDPTHGSGTQTGTITCTGTQCAQAEAIAGVTLPCMAVVSFTTSLL